MVLKTPKTPPNFSTAYPRAKLPAETKATQSAVLPQPAGVDNKLKPVGSAPGAPPTTYGPLGWRTYGDPNAPFGAPPSAPAVPESPAVRQGPSLLSKIGGFIADPLSAMPGGKSMGMQIPGKTTGLPPAQYAMPPVPTPPAGPASSAIAGEDPISAGLKAIDRQFGDSGSPMQPTNVVREGGAPMQPQPAAQAISGARPPAPPVPPAQPAAPPVTGPSANQALQQGRDQAMRRIDPNNSRGWGAINDQQNADALSQSQAAQAQSAEMTAGLRDSARLRGMPPGTTVSPQGQIVAAPKPAAPYEIRGGRILPGEDGVGSAAGEGEITPGARRQSAWYEDGRTAPGVVGGSGHRILRPVDPAAQADSDRSSRLLAKMQGQERERISAAAEAAKTPAMRAQEKRRADYLSGSGNYSDAKMEQGKTRAEVVARRQARKDAVAARQMYKGEGRVARLERRKWGPSLQEQMMSQMDPQTAAAFMVGMDRNRAMSSGQEAENDMRRAQAANLRSEAGARDAMLAGQRQGPAAQAAAGAEDPGVAYANKLGIEPGMDMATGLIRKYQGGEVPEQDQEALVEWANNTQPEKSGGFWNSLTGAGSGIARNNELRMAIRAGDWPRVNQILKGAPKGSAPDIPPTV